MTDPRLFLENFDAPDDDFDELIGSTPNVSTKWATFGVNQLVGNGSVTNGKCGTFSAHYGCLEGDLHKGVKLNGEDCTGKGFFRVVLNSCHKPSCPICYESWGGREAHKIDGRLLEASKRFGGVEHIVASVPPERYGMDFDACRKYILKALVVRGVIGGASIFHGFRYNQYREICTGHRTITFWASLKVVIIVVGRALTRSVWVGIRSFCSVTDLMLAPVGVLNLTV